MRYRAVRLPGSDTWCIEKSKRGLFGGVKYVKRYYVRFGSVGNYRERFVSKASAERRIDDLLNEPSASDQGEQGEWKP